MLLNIYYSLDVSLDVPRRPWVKGLVSRAVTALIAKISWEVHESLGALLWRAVSMREWL